MNGETEAGEALFIGQYHILQLPRYLGTAAQVDCCCLRVMEAETGERFTAALQPGPGWWAPGLRAPELCGVQSSNCPGPPPHPPALRPEGLDSAWRRPLSAPRLPIGGA